MCVCGVTSVTITTQTEIRSQMASVSTVADGPDSKWSSSEGSCMSCDARFHGASAFSAGGRASGQACLARGSTLCQC